jgi:hypothetical protein
MQPVSSFSRGSLNPSDPGRAIRQRRERLIEQALWTQRRLPPRPRSARQGRVAAAS